MQAVLISLAVVSFASYAWAIGRLFTRPDGLSWPMRLLSACGSAGALAHVVSLGIALPASPGRQAIAAVPYLGGLFLFGWACHVTRHDPLPIAFSETPARRLVAAGPYRLMRHPFYTAYSLTWLAGCIAAPTVATVAAFAVMLVLYVVAARREERQLLASPLGEMYRVYQRRP